ncbi:MAG: protein kinase [Thermomicrobiales bacterium]
MNDERTGASMVDDDPAEGEPAAQTAVPSALDGDPRTTIAGRYSVDLQISPIDDGIAVAYPGRDLRTRDPVWVKTLRVEYRSDSAVRARFRREARLLQFLSHPNVVRALTYSEERGAPWLVIERPPGRSLREEMAASGAATPESVVPVIEGVAAALDHLHARGLVHLDLRPGKMVLTPGDEVKLLDFGVAHSAGSELEATPGPLEDDSYPAPEQLCGEPVTTATDVYALGCIVYELLTGSPPFSQPGSPSERNAALRARLDTVPPPPTAKNNTLPPWVDDVVLGALHRDPRQRYGSAGSFAAVFRAGVEGDVDVETGRPRARPESSRTRQVPINEPGIAVKGTPRLAARRAEPERDDLPSDVIVDAAFVDHATGRPIVPDTPRSRSGVDLDRLSRRLWQAVLVAVVLNLVLILGLAVTRGEVPGIWHRAAVIGPGATVRIAGAGLVARERPENAAPIVADLPDGGEVRVTGDRVAGDGGMWWPVTVDTNNGPVSGFVPELWVHAP